MQIGDKLTKETYTVGALWCNENNAHIEKQGNDYVIVANPLPTPPTKEELIAQLDKQYTEDKSLLREYYTEADMLGDEELKAELSAELTNVNVAYDEALAVIESEE